MWDYIIIFTFQTFWIRQNTYFHRLIFSKWSVTKQFVLLITGIYILINSVIPFKSLDPFLIQCTRSSSWSIHIMNWLACDWYSTYMIIWLNYKIIVKYWYLNVGIYEIILVFWKPLFQECISIFPTRACLSLCITSNSVLVLGTACECRLTAETLRV